MDTLVETWGGKTLSLLITDLPYGVGLYDGWRVINRANAESLARSHPETWRIEDSEMKWLQLILQFFPSVIQIIIAIEQAVKGLPPTTSTDAAGTVTMTPAVVTGPQKRALALAVLQPPSAEVDGVGKLIDVSVGALNSTGIFTKAA